MASMQVPPSDPREVEALRRIAELESASRSQSRWTWATILPLAVRMLGMLILIWAAVGLAIGIATGHAPLGTVAQAFLIAAVGIAMVVSATWGYRYAHQRAFGRDSRAGL